jgi:uncharacterized BrkB/YihY/UPF0761 family membrane protein
LFPLLLLLVTILDLVLVHDAGLRRAVLSAALEKFPGVGGDLRANLHAMHRSSLFGFIVSIAGLAWASLGLAQAGIFAMEQVWNIPGPGRPNYVKRLARSLSFLVILAAGLVITTGLAGLGTAAGKSLGITVAGDTASAFINAGLFVAAFRVLTPRGVPTRQLLPGAVAGGVAWTVLQALGGYVVGHYLHTDDAVYGTFGVVLGLVAWIYFGAELTVYAAEINVVWHRRLWPRAIAQPPLTEADQAVMAAQAKQNQRRPEQNVHVSFTEPAMTEDEFLSAEQD